MDTGLTEADIKLQRGTPKETLARIRERYALGENVTDLDIFYLAYVNYNGAHMARIHAEEHFDRYCESGTLPECVWRCGDPDVDYTGRMTIK